VNIWSYNSLYLFILIKHYFYILSDLIFHIVSAITTPITLAKAFSPGHITGLIGQLVTQNNSNDYLYFGSIGAGFSIDCGIKTIVEVSNDKTTSYQISINGIEVEDAEVSRWVIERYLRLIDQPYHINIKHQIGIPVGFGLGSSGAAALSLSYALNDALNIGLTKKQAAQIAHHAEIVCNTGLGTVIAEFSGGFEMRTSIGAPGIGTIKKLKLEDHKAIILCISPISTKSFLGKHSELMSRLGEKMLDKLKVSESIDDFLNLSYEFASNLDLTKGKCKEPIECLKSHGFNCGVALFGETVFTIVPSAQTKKAKECLDVFKGNLIICNIDNIGARVL
jgi:pantoate kinase